MRRRFSARIFQSLGTAGLLKFSESCIELGCCFLTENLNLSERIHEPPNMVQVRGFETILLLQIRKTRELELWWK